MSRLLILNAGSSSLKFALIEMPAQHGLLRGRIEGIGTQQSVLRTFAPAGEGSEHAVTARDHSEALSMALSHIERTEVLSAPLEPDLIGHRIVHGGISYTEPVVLDNEVLASIEVATQLAPLHNTASLAVVRSLEKQLPGIPQIAVFDTAFHQTLPEYAHFYGLPLHLQRENGVRRYGFHGISHRYVANEAARWLGRPIEELKLISLHLGSGASACAIDGGKSIETSMGFTPLEGLVMGTRCGDLDPTLPSFLARRLGLDDGALERLLQKQSGLLGLCGDSDMRKIEARREAGDEAATLAFEMFCYRIRKYIGAYYAVLNGLDAILFTAGIGERSALVRQAVCTHMEALGVGIDASRNGQESNVIRDIADEDRPVRLLVVPTDEEMAIAEACHRGWST